MTTLTPAPTSMLPRSSKLWIGGEWLPAATEQTFEVCDPATGAPIAECANADGRDATAALDAAADAAAAWSQVPARTRAEILRRVYDEIVARADEFAAVITAEAGKPLSESRSEVAYGAEFFRWFSEEAPRIAGRYGPNPEGTGEVIVSHRPVGPCYLVTPWNFPLAMAARKIAPALAAGCTMVVKPADLTPLTTVLLCSVLANAGVPAGVVNVVTTTNPAAVSDALMSDPRLRKVSFTGSTPVGRQLIAQSAQHVLRTSMELGGNAPFLVFEDADLDAAVEGAMIATSARHVPPRTGSSCTHRLPSGSPLRWLRLSRPSRSALEPCRVCPSARSSATAPSRTPRSSWRMRAHGGRASGPAGRRSRDPARSSRRPSSTRSPSTQS